MTTPTRPSPDPAGDALLLALTDAIRSATGPEIQQAQALLLRRLATEGDVIPSRIPAPRNITEVGGYLNLLTTLAENTMRRDMIGAALGLASTPFGVGGVGAVPPLRLTAVPNDRPAGAVGATVPLAVTVRADLATPLQSALDTVHADGGLLPLWSPPTALPPAPQGARPMPDPLPHLGREVFLAPTAALTDPATDPIVLGRAATDVAAGYRAAVRVAAGTAGAPALDWTALVFDTVGGGFVERALGTVELLPIDVALAGTPFVARPVPAAPTGRGDLTWARLVATAGLVPGLSRLGDELALVWNADAIASSAFATHLDAIWDGAAFAG